MTADESGKESSEPAAATLPPKPPRLQRPDIKVKESFLEEHDAAVTVLKAARVRTR